MVGEAGLLGDALCAEVCLGWLAGGEVTAKRLADSSSSGKALLGDTCGGDLGEEDSLRLRLLALPSCATH